MSHVIYLGHFSRCPTNVAIPTMHIQCLNESSMNDVRNYWLTAIAGHQGNAPNNTSREGPTGAQGTGGTPGPGAHKTRGTTQQQPALHSNTWSPITRIPRVHLAKMADHCPQHPGPRTRNPGPGTRNPIPRTRARTTKPQPRRIQRDRGTGGGVKRPTRAQRPPCRAGNTRLSARSGRRGCRAR